MLDRLLGYIDLCSEAVQYFICSYLSDFLTGSVFIFSSLTVLQASFDILLG